jgi:hypothetical protein
MTTKKGVSKNHKKPVGAVTQKLTPSFTADRLFVWLVGGAAALTGIYIIGRFVKMGLDKLEGKEDEAKKTPDKPVNTGGGVTAGNETLPTPSNFPITPDWNNLITPHYRRDVEILQQAIKDIWGERENPLPVYGVDGKFGYETLNAVKRYINAQGIVTKGQWESLAKTWANVLSLKRQSIPVANENAIDMVEEVQRIRTYDDFTPFDKPMPLPTDFLNQSVSESPIDVFMYDFKKSDGKDRFTLEGLGNVDIHAIV